MVGGGDRRNSLGHCILLEISSTTFNSAFIDLSLALSDSSLLPPPFEMTEAMRSLMNIPFCVQIHHSS